MGNNVIITSLVAAGIIGALALAYKKNSELDNERALVQAETDKVEAIIKRRTEDPHGFLVDSLEGDWDRVVLSEGYGYYESKEHVFEHRDFINPQESFKRSSIQILGHDKDGQDWYCEHTKMSYGGRENESTASIHNGKEGWESKTAFDHSLCEELPEGTIPRFAPGMSEV